ncbi:MAG: transcriptional regulator [Acidimicrobiales bacterium]|nr:transcriptional regulator [Acidimicrobiales bacterium]
MTLLIFALLGLALGIGAERLVGSGARARDGVPGQPDVPGSPGERVRRRRSPRRIIGLGALAVVIVLLATAVGGYLWADSVFDKIEKVEVGDALSHGSGTNYLLVGSDNGRTAEDQRKGVSGARSDTIMVLRIEGGTAQMLSLNRDLFVTNPRTGTQGRINATYQDANGQADPANLIRTVTENFQIPVDHYIEIDFASFGSLVESFGGIDINFPNPAFDRASGLDVEQAGLVHLDGAQALAYVRSRHYTEVIDGQEVEDKTSDLGRVQRQQVFLREIMKQAGSKRNPFTLMSAADKMSGGLRIDDQMSMIDAARFAWNMGRLDPVTVQLPVVGRRLSSGAEILEPGPGAEEVLARFR